MWRIQWCVAIEAVGEADDDPLALRQLAEGLGQGDVGVVGAVGEVHCVGTVGNLPGFGTFVKRNDRMMVGGFGESSRHL